MPADRPPDHQNLNTPGPPPFAWQEHSEAENAMIRARQKSRARVMAWLLGAFVILLFAISIVRIKGGMG